MKETIQLNKEIADLLVRKGNWIHDYPACSYEIPKILDKLTEYESSVTDDFLLFVLFFVRKTMENIWASISSAASENIPVERQLELMKMIGHHWSLMGQSLSIPDKIQFLDSAISFIADYLRLTGYSIRKG